MPSPTVLPPKDGKAAAVRSMFSAIAPRYDTLNHLLSLNVDRRWRRRTVDQLLHGRRHSGLFLDACCGTFDLALELARRPTFDGRVLASDFAIPMLQRGRGKIQRAPVQPLAGDALQLPFADQTFDGATVGFGVRNLADLGAGTRELRRVLKPGARLVILEFSTPTWQPFRALYLFYFLRVLPAIGRRLSRHRNAYDYLPASVLEFATPQQLADLLTDEGFEHVEWTTLTGGIVALHSGSRT